MILIARQTMLSWDGHGEEEVERLTSGQRTAGSELRAMFRYSDEPAGEENKFLCALERKEMDMTVNAGR